jgi:hypothetical protein
MLRSAASKVMWVGRATSAVVALAIVLALVVGLASAAFGANGQAWILGQSNVATAITKLAGAAGVDGPILQLKNNNADANDTALDLRVQSGEAPMRVNSTTMVTNLNADKVNGQDAEAIKPLLADVLADGTLDNTFANSRGAVSAERLGTGIYEVTFDRDVHNCVRVGTAGLPLNAALFPDNVRLQQDDGQVSTFNSTRGDDKIGVITNSASGAPADRAFQMAVYC